MYWKHYKGGLYKIVGPAAIHSETLEEMVVYQKIDRETGPGQVWVRPKIMWDQLVETEAGKVPRFEPLTEANCDHEMEGIYEPECKWCGYCTTK